MSLSSLSQDRASGEEANHTVPATFLEWTVYNALDAHIDYEGVPELTETALLQEIEGYTSYLRGGPFHQDYLASFVEQVSRLHSSDEANFDFLPSTSQNVLSFRNWVELKWSENITGFSDDVEYTRPEATRHQRFHRTVALYAQYLVDSDAFVESLELVASRNWLAENNLRELNNLCRMDHTYGAEGEWIPTLEDADMSDFDASANESSLPEHQNSAQIPGEELFEGENLRTEQDDADHQEYQDRYWNLIIHTFRLAFARWPRPQEEGESDEDDEYDEYDEYDEFDEFDEDADDEEADEEDENDVETDDEMSSLPRQPWEIREMIENAAREAMEEEAQMDESSEDEDDLERQGHRPWRLVRPIRTRRPFFDPSLP